MKRSLADINARAKHRRALSSSLAAFALVGSAGCTLFAGQPWGEADLTLAAAFAPPASRLTDDGRLKTSRDYALAIDELLITFDAVALSVSDDGAALSFDPADPPPGYSLCHGGHCHADDGRLVDYDEIERSLSDGGGGSVLALPIEDGVLALDEDPAALELEPCEGGCVLERGVLRSLSVAMSVVDVTATVTDLRPPAAARLPPEGVSLSARVLGSALVTAALAVPLDGSEDPGLALSVLLEVAPELFDGVDFGALPSDDDRLLLDDEAEAALLESLAESVLVVEVTRAPLERSFSPLLFPVDEDQGETP